MLLQDLSNYCANTLSLNCPDWRTNSFPHKFSDRCTNTLSHKFSHKCAHKFPYKCAHSLAYARQKRVRIWPILR